jgi:hypothetical protein
MVGTRLPIGGAHSTIHSSLSWTQGVNFQLIIEVRVGNVGLICKDVIWFGPDSIIVTILVLHPDVSYLPISPSVGV